MNGELLLTYLEAFGMYAFVTVIVAVIIKYFQKKAEP